MRREASRAAATAATAVTVVLLASVAGADRVLRSSDPGTSFERTYPAVLAGVALLMGTATASLWLLVALSSTAAVGVCLSVSILTAAVGWWAGWEWLPDPVRAATPGLAVLAAPALAEAVRRWPPATTVGGPLRRGSALAAAAAALLHLAAYDPFTQVDCLRSCAGTTTLWRVVGVADPTPTLGAVAALVLASVGLACADVVDARTAPLVVRLAAIVGLLGVAATVAGPTMPVGAVDVPVDLVVAATTSAAACVSGAVGWRWWRRRRAADRVLADLRAAPALDLDELELQALTPAQRLVLDNARLEHRARRAVAAARAAQAAAIRIADDERSRLERDLHDGAQQQLVAAALHLTVASSRAPADRADEVTAARTQVLATLDRLRAISHGPFPAMLTDDGLVPALTELVADHAGRLHVDSVAEDDIGEEVGRTAYAVARDLLAAAGPGSELSVSHRADVLVLRATTAQVVASPLSDPVRDRLRALAADVVVERSGREVEVRIPCGS